MISFIIPHSNMILQNDEVASIQHTQALNNNLCVAKLPVSFLFTLTCRTSPGQTKHIGMHGLKYSSSSSHVILNVHTLIIHTLIGTIDNV